MGVDSQLIWKGLAKNFDDATLIELGRQGAHDLLCKTNPPTAIIAMNDMYAFGVYVGARDLGLNIPMDISVVGVDDINFTEIVLPPLTTVRQPIKAITSLAVERLVGRLQNTCNEPKGLQMLSPELIVRSSTAPPSQSKQLQRKR